MHSREIKELKEQNLINIKSYEVKINELTQNILNLETENKNSNSKIILVEKEKNELSDEIQKKINYYEQKIESIMKENRFY